ERPPLNDIALYETEPGTATHIELPTGIMPTHFLTLCDWGCGIYSHLDCVYDRVFRGEYGRDDMYVLELEARSLFEWLDRWTKGEVNFYLQDGNYLTREGIAELSRKQKEKWQAEFAEQREKGQAAFAALSQDQKNEIAEQFKKQQHDHIR